MAKASPKSKAAPAAAPAAEEKTVTSTEQTSTSAGQEQQSQDQQQAGGDAQGTAPVVEGGQAAATVEPGADAAADAAQTPGADVTGEGNAPTAETPAAVVETAPVAPVVETPPAAPAAPEVKAAEQAPEAPKGDYPEVTGIADVDRILKSVPATSLAPIHRLLDYVVAMHPKKPLSIEEGARQQVALFKVIQNVINREDQHFRALFTAILGLFEAHKAGVFHETNVFRFMEHIALNDSERKAFQRLLNLVKVTANRESRSTSVKQVNFTDSLRYGLTDEGRQRVLEYFQVGH